MSTNKSARRIAVVLCSLILLSGCFGKGGGAEGIEHTVGGARLANGTLPRPDHVVIVVEENTNYARIIGSPDARFLNKLVREGVAFRHSHGITHPSQPNYLALFSGTTQGITDDGCDHAFTGANLASELGKADLSFVQYSQGLPDTGFRGCKDGAYVRKHNPAVNWQPSNVAPGQNRPFSDFPDNFDELPTVSLVSPDLDHDMHDGSIQAGDRWLEENLGSYARWATRHNSLLVVTWDEDDGRHDNRIATIAVGSMIKPGESTQPIDHHNVLRTLETMYGLPLLGKSADAAPITGIWAAVERHRPDKRPQ